MNAIQANYGNQRVGTLAEARGGIFFEYDRRFLATGQELSPLHLPLGPGVLARESQPTLRLPGLFEDSLPDLWGRRLMTEWFRRQGTPAHAITPLMMLAYVGRRGMGALTYDPALALTPVTSSLSLAAIHAAAARAEIGPIDLNLLAQVGSSAGGARPKALIGLPCPGQAGAIIDGTADLPPSHECWLIKFDLSPDAAEGPMEEAFARMARAAGIEVPDTQLLPTEQPAGPRRHFAVKRFDRAGPERIHHHSLAGLCHLGGGDLDYATFLRVTRRLTREEPEVRKAFRRAAFNVLASNRDDHGKNHGFLYRRGQWRLAPAFDLTFTSPAQLPERGMAVAGERRRAGLSHLRQLAEGEDLDRRIAAETVEEVRSAVSRWGEFAAKADVPVLLAREIGDAIRQTAALAT